DEHDREEAPVAQRGAAIEFAADLRPDEVMEQTGLDIHEGPHYDTVAGFMLYQLGKIAEPGDLVPVPGGVLTVVKMDGMRIDRIRFTPVEEEPASGEVNEHG